MSARYLPVNPMTRWSSGTLSMESGWVDATKYWFPLNPGAQPEPEPPGKVYYTERQIDAQDDARPFLDTLIPDKPPRPYTAGMDSTGFPGGIDDKRDYRWHTARTGKLKAWIQALLGYSQPKWTPDKHENKQHKSMDAAAYTLAKIAGDGWQSKNKTHGLYTTSDYQYFFVEILLVWDEYRIFATPLKLSGPARRLRQWLVDGTFPDGSSISDAQRMKIESYLLAGCGLLENERAQIASLGQDPVQGWPFYYGWHFNWQGDEAHMVTSERVMVDADPDPYVKWHIGRHYKLRLIESSYNPEQPLSFFNRPFGPVLSLLEQVEYTPPQDHYLWFPNTRLAFDRMEVYYWLTTSPSEYPEILYHDAPVYCYWQREPESMDEQLVMVRHKLMEPEDRSDDPEPTVLSCDLGQAAVEARRYDAYRYDGYSISRLGRHFPCVSHKV